jgi:hypothetical protein
MKQSRCFNVLAGVSYTVMQIYMVVITRADSGVPLAAKGSNGWCRVTNRGK